MPSPLMTEEVSDSEINLSDTSNHSRSSTSLALHQLFNRESDRHSNSIVDMSSSSIENNSPQFNSLEALHGTPEASRVSISTDSVDSEASTASFENQFSDDEEPHCAETIIDIPSNTSPLPNSSKSSPVTLTIASQPTVSTWDINQENDWEPIEIQDPELVDSPCAIEMSEIKRRKPDPEVMESVMQGVRAAVEASNPQPVAVQPQPLTIKSRIVSFFDSCRRRAKPHAEANEQVKDDHGCCLLM